MHPTMKNSSIIVLIFGVAFFMIDLVVPQSGYTARSKSPSEIGNSWGLGCWAELEKADLDTYKRNKGKMCHRNTTCSKCCERKRKSCGRKYSKTKCDESYSFCVDKVRPTRIPGRTGFKAPSGRVKRPPTLGQRLRQMRVQQYFQWGGVRSRGIESGGPESPLPLVIPDPVPPTRPTLER